MKRLLSCAASAFLCACAAFAADIVVGTREAAELHVPDSATLSDRVVLAEDAQLIKTGEGKLTVTQSALADTPFRMSVLAGTVAVTPGTAAPTPVTVPSVIAEKAALWLDASAAGSLLGDGGTALAASETPQDVRTWRDCRETTTASTYPYLTASNAAKTVAVTVGYPQSYVTNSRAGVHFGGFGSGRYMDLRDASGMQKSYDTAIYHAYFVHGIEKTFGYILGRRAGDANWYFSGTHSVPGMAAMHTLAPSVIGGSYAANWMLNGRWFDAFSEAPQTGVQMLEEHCTEKLVTFSALFASKAQDAPNQPGSKGAVGGDMLHEVIIFTKRLSEREQATIRDYLMRKWTIDYGYAGLEERSMGSYPETYELASGTTLEAAPAADAETRPVAFSGAGTVVKKGVGTLVLGPSAQEGFSGDFDLQAGAVLARGGRLPAVTGAGGEVLDAAAVGDISSSDAAVRAANGAKLTKTTGGTAGVLRKTGDETARVKALAADVDKIEVAAGTLVLEAPVTQTGAPAAVDTSVTVTGTNLDFEVSSTTGNWPTDGGMVDGWWWAYDNGAYFANKLSLADWNVVPQGSYCLMRSGWTDLFTTIDIPAAGTYEISFLHTTRYWQNSLGDANRMVTDVGIKKYEAGASTRSYRGNLTRIGTFRGSVVPWPRMYMRFTVAEAGKYVLGFENRYLTGVDNHGWIDDIKFRYITEKPIAGAYEIPNGDFEQIPADAINHTAFRVDNQCTGWTFTQPAETSDARIGVVSPDYRNGSGQFLLGDASVRGNTQLQFIGNVGVASATFTPPAGTWRLRGGISHVGYLYNSSSYLAATPGLTARVSQGDVTTTLGTRTVSDHALTFGQWPTAFTTDGETPVTLELQGSDAAGGLVADDFLLVPAEAIVETPELVKNGGFEIQGGNANEAKNWSPISPLAPKNGKYQEWSRTSANVHYAPNIFEGKHCMRIKQNHGVQQTIDFPSVGLYRLRFVLAPRPGTTYGYNTIRALLRKSDGTQSRELGRAMPGANGWVEYVFDFNVESFGQWVLAFEGMGYLKCEAILPGNDQSRCDHTSCFDAVSVRRVADAFAATPTVGADQKPKITVAKNARLTLDFDGCLKVRTLRLGDVSARPGKVKASDYPEYLAGRGELEIVPEGMMLIVR